MQPETSTPALRRYKFDTETTTGRVALDEYIRTWIQDNRQHVLEATERPGEYFRAQIENEQFWDGDDKIEFADDMQYVEERFDRAWINYLSETPVYYVTRKAIAQYQNYDYETIAVTFNEEEAVSKVNELNESAIGGTGYEVLYKESTDAFFRYYSGDVFEGRLK